MSVQSAVCPRGSATHRHKRTLLTPVSLHLKSYTNIALHKSFRTGQKYEVRGF